MMICFKENRKLNREAWFRLLGVTRQHFEKAKSDEKMQSSIERLGQQMDEAEALLFDVAEPCFVYRILDRNQLDVKGTSLTKHLEGCGQVILSAVTLGAAVDILIEETQKTKIALGVVIDSGASVMADLAATLATEQIRTDLADNPAPAGSSESRTPLFITQRFSPGYGDSPLEMQIQLLNFLDAENALGITLSKGLMMSPSKSITYIIGLADHPVTGRLATCGECVLRDKCQYKETAPCSAGGDIE